jgi:hypothetical protein
VVVDQGLDDRRVGKHTCPMHPEIVRLGPASCPICGMDLEPRTASVRWRNTTDFTGAIRSTSCPTLLRRQRAATEAR